MDVTEQRYRKIINTYRPLMANVVTEYPIPLEMELPLTRNLKYIVEKQKYSNNLPSQFFEDIYEQIKILMNDQAQEVRLLALRLGRCLPFVNRVKLIQQTQNELSTFMNRMQTQSPPVLGSPEKKGPIVEKKTTGMGGASSAMGGNSNVINSQFHYEAIADMTDFLLSVYELSGLSEDIYFDVNQKVTSIFSRILEQCLSGNRQIVRNSFEALRSIFMVFGQYKGRYHQEEDYEQQTTQLAESGVYRQKKIQLISPMNKLISKIISIFSKQQNYQIPTSSLSSTIMMSSPYSSVSPTIPILRQLILKTREYEVRVRCRMLTGVAFLLTHVPDHVPEIYDLLIKQVFLLMHNANQFDILVQCFLSIKAILALPTPKPTRIKVLKDWSQVLANLAYSYKKQYLEFYVGILREICEYNQCPIHMKYLISTSYLQLTTVISQQFSRFIIYKLSCRAIVSLMSMCSSNVLMNFFQYTWFINRSRDDSDLFRSQFLICLLHEYFAHPCVKQIQDLISLCHYLLDWQCSSKEQTHIPTIKFAFDMYLQFLKQAAHILGEGIEKYVQELIQRCNQPKMYILFKFKLIATFIRLDSYKSIMTYSQTKLDLSFLEGEVTLFMMPRNPKPIFDYEYSLTGDGEIQSRKEIQTIKVIMDLLSAVQEVHRQKQETVNNLVIKYHQYLADLEVQPGSNRDLINCLQSLQADNYFSQCQRNFLLALIDDQDRYGNNLEFTLDGRIIHSPMEAYDCDQEYNIFGGMSPVHMKIRILGGRSYTSVYIQIKKSQWVTVPEMKLVISSAMEVKQIPFQSCIVEIKVDRIGLINFQAWTLEGTPLMLGSGSYRINRNFKWLRVDHLKIIDGIRSKAFLGTNMQMLQQSKRQDSNYLTFCFGEPVLVQIIYSRNQIVVTVTNKDIWHEIQQLIANMLQQLTDGAAEVIDYKLLKKGQIINEGNISKV